MPSYVYGSFAATCRNLNRGVVGKSNNEPSSVGWRKRRREWKLFGALLGQVGNRRRDESVDDGQDGEVETTLRRK